MQPANEKEQKHEKDWIDGDEEKEAKEDEEERQEEEK